MKSFNSDPGLPGQKLRLSHEAVNVAAVTDLQHRVPGQEPRIVRSALNENLVAGQAQARQLRDLAQAAPGDHLIPRPSRYAVHDGHHPAGQIVRTRETRDTVRVHHNREARTGWLMSRLHHGGTPPPACPQPPLAQPQPAQSGAFRMPKDSNTPPRQAEIIDLEIVRTNNNAPLVTLRNYKEC